MGIQFASLSPYFYTERDVHTVPRTRTLLDDVMHFYDLELKLGLAGMGLKDQGGGKAKKQKVK